MNAPLKKLSELTGVVFDGRRSGYVPPKTLSISPKLKLHKKAKKDLDPVTFEVVRHAVLRAQRLLAVGAFADGGLAASLPFQ